MKKITALVLCSALILVSGGDTPNKKTGNEQVPVQPITDTPVQPSPITTTTVKTSTSSEIPSTEPTKPTTTTTTTTTTPAPTTTSTTSTTTTSTTPSTTSTEPITTSTAAPPTTSAPPVPEPSTRKWTFNGTDGTLIIVKMAAQVEIMYNSTSNKQLSKKLDIPTDNSTNVSGEILPSNEAMTLSWKSATNNSDNSVKLHFARSEDAKTYALSGLTVTIAAEELPNFPSNSSLVLLHMYKHYNTSIGNSYRCVKLQNFNLTAVNSNGTVGQLKVTDLQFQAFKTDKKNSFGFAEDCAFDTPDVVPIAVGCVLAGLVVIVLGAYLINRRRSQARGYHSM